MNTPLNNDVTIIVNSCDKYECAWEPFFKLFKINWPECESFNIILNTEEKKYECYFCSYIYDRIFIICGSA